MMASGFIFSLMLQIGCITKVEHCRLNKGMRKTSLHHVFTFKVLFELKLHYISLCVSVHVYKIDTFLQIYTMYYYTK